MITQVALKVRPLPKAVRTLVTDEGGLELGAQLLEAVPLPAAVVVEHDRILLRLEGWPEEVEEQARAATSVAVMADADPAAWPDAAFPDAPIVAEAAVPPSRLEALLEGVDRYRAVLGVGLRLGALRRRGIARDASQAGAELGGSAPVVLGEGGLDDRRAPASRDPGADQGRAAIPRRAMLESA